MYLNTELLPDWRIVTRLSMRKIKHVQLSDKGVGSAHSPVEDEVDSPNTEALLCLFGACKEARTKRAGMNGNTLNLLKRFS